MITGLAGAAAAAAVAPAGAAPVGTVTTASSSTSVSGTFGPSGFTPTAPTTTPTAPTVSQPRATGTRSLAAFLQAGGGRFLGDRSPAFDTNPNDFDITFNLALKVIGDKPGSPVSLLTRGDVPLTLFLPVDGAWRGLAIKATGNPGIVSQPDRVIFDAVASLGTDTVEKVLLYHVVPKTLTFRDLQRLVGQDVQTALGQRVRIDSPFRSSFGPPLTLQVIDADPDSRTPTIEGQIEGNQGNVQVAQVINSVLRPRL
jgi:hypothetical protein